MGRSALALSGDDRGGGADARRGGRGVNEAPGDIPWFLETMVNDGYL